MQFGFNSAFIYIDNLVIVLLKMVSVVSFLTLILAYALPSAFAAKLCTPYKTVEVYRKDLPDKSEFTAAGSADAYGDNTYTYVSQYLY